MSNMSRSDFLFYVVTALFIGGSALTWYLLHPDSPYIERHTYTFVVPESGTLEEGNMVIINGIEKGRVYKVINCGDSVCVDVGITLDVEVPKDSRMQVVNSGLVGDRAVAIQMGASTEMLSPGDTLHGGYDNGPARLGKALGDAFAQIGAVNQQVKDIWNATLGDSIVQMHLANLGPKAKDLLQNAKGLFSSIRYGTAKLKKDLKGLQSNVDSLQGDMKEPIAALQGDIQSIQEQIIKLEVNLKKIQQSLKKSMDQENIKDGSVVRLVQKDWSQIKSLLENMESLQKKLTED